ncbi:MAG: DUF177 domain-containing protein [Bacteroidales bacterium]|nr:DUF177 domain-containing protein [Bacteroidales bacterium]
MAEAEKYVIPFKSMADGVHNFRYKVGDDFFAEIDNSLIERGDIDAVVEMTKNSQMLRFHFELNGKITVPCDVCLEDMDYPIEECEGDMVVKFGETTEEISDELFQLAEGENEISVAQWIYEILAVSLPMRFVHPEDENGNPTCNAEMLEKLNQYLVTEVKTDPEKPIMEATDPRWDALKGLIDKQ